MQYTYDYPMPSVTATVIAFSITGRHTLTILTIERKHDPFKGYLCLPGGFLNAGKESLEECARRELKEETGLVITDDDDYLERVTVQSSPDRDPRGHVIDNVYAVLVDDERLKNVKAADDAARIVEVEFDTRKVHETLNRTRLAFDHEQSIREFFKPAILRR